MKSTPFAPGRFIAVVAALTILAVDKAQAGFPIPLTVSIDENGHGSFTAVGVGPFALTGVLAPDPGPGGRPSALTYTGPFGFLPGDVILTEAGGMSDIIRFNSSSSIVFYSLPGEGQLADTGLPSALYANNISLPENLFGPTSYTPLAGQPGYNPAAPGVIFFFNSPSAVPESGSNFLLLAAAVGGLLCLRRRLVSYIAEDVR
jgi:hypothetical protein